MGAWKIRFRYFDLGDGWLPLPRGDRLEHTRIAIRLVRAIQNRRAIRFQHHKHEDVDRGSSQRVAARRGVWISLTCTSVETDRMDGRQLVALGYGSCCRVSIAIDAHRAGDHHAALQQVYAAEGRSLARTPVCARATHKFSHPQYRGNGWQQTLASLQRFLHRIRTISK